MMILPRKYFIVKNVGFVGEGRGRILSTVIGVEGVWQLNIIKITNV
jgi:hypothetical protein